MTREDIFKKTQDILANEFEIEKDAITLEAKLYDDFELESIDAVDFLVKMKEFTLGKIDPELFKKAVTVQDVVSILHPLSQET